jgi:hypothetical protein
LPVRQFGAGRAPTQAGYAALVRQGIGQPGLGERLRDQVFLGSEALVERLCVAPKPLERLREVPRAQGRPLADFAHLYPNRIA